MATENGEGVGEGGGIDGQGSEGVGEARRPVRQLSNVGASTESGADFEPHPSGLGCDLWVVVVTTRATYFGRMCRDDYVRACRGRERLGAVLLQDCQFCNLWSDDMHGFSGLANQGPNDQCRIGDVVSEHLVMEPCGILVATDEARKAWQRKPWRP